MSLPSDKSFASYEEARAHVQGPRLPSDLDLYWSQVNLDVLLDYSIQSDRSDFSIDMQFDRLGGTVNTALRFVPPGGTVRAFEFHGSPGLVYLDPSWTQAVLRFVVEGFWHILDGTDHLLFLACLVIPLRQLRPLIVTVTSFTVAHSITLLASAFGFAPNFLWFPPLIETLIAATIVFMALENIVGATRPTAGFTPLRLASSTASAFRSHCANSCSSPATIWSPRCSASMSVSKSGRSACSWCWFPCSTCCLNMWSRTHRGYHPVGVRGAHGVALDARAR